jgi:hypothetical protein
MRAQWRTGITAMLFTHSLTQSLTHLLTHSLTHSRPYYSLIHSLNHSLTHSLTQSLTNLLTHLLITHLLTHLLTHSITHSLSHSLTHSLTAWSRVLFEKPTGSWLVKKFPTFYGARRFITAYTSARQLFLSWGSSIQSIPPRPASWRSILILPSHIHIYIIFMIYDGKSKISQKCGIAL